ncbi:MAG: DUF1919 domain-containing protein [Sarcina sp.]
MIGKIKDKINNLKRKKYTEKYKEQFRNEKVTIISSNCIGGLLSSDFGIRFNSPTINLFMYPRDFLKYVKELKYYNQVELIEDKDAKESYPVGKLKDITIYFMHYKTFSEAKNKWCERKERIIYDNIIIISTDRDGMTYEQLKEFDELEYVKKVVFTHKKYDELKSSFYVKGYEDNGEVPPPNEYIKSTGLRYYDSYDFVSLIKSK